MAVPSSTCVGLTASKRRRLRRHRLLFCRGMQAGQGPPGVFFCCPDAHRDWCKAKDELSRLLPFLFGDVSFLSCDIGSPGIATPHTLDADCGFPVIVSLTKSLGIQEQQPQSSSVAETLTAGTPFNEAGAHTSNPTDADIQRMIKQTKTNEATMVIEERHSAEAPDIFMFGQHLCETDASDPAPKMAAKRRIVRAVRSYRTAVDPNAKSNVNTQEVSRQCSDVGFASARSHLNAESVNLGQVGDRQDRRKRQVSPSALQHANVDSDSDLANQESHAKSPWILFGIDHRNNYELKGLDLDAQATKLQHLWRNLGKKEKEIFEKRARDAGWIPPPGLALLRKECI
eukprot:gnl/MRDRNA2_/MRDRNA2_117414_c0_seq1.p1 gnl/MRDRNA2_/MRDRNA2_117414_c0~~gnl/MRDRNA2_/MRDRNA2_117414_c0_seq1.p1  ORF type:complete len:343 (-),score=48.22 gnl/MRDRNA2_/MRDRNA2_117414_c0_seq1:156-1184(-)